MGPAIRLMVKIPPRTTLRVIDGLILLLRGVQSMFPQKDQIQENVAKPQAPHGLEKDWLSLIGGKRIRR